MNNTFLNCRIISPVLQSTKYSFWNQPRSNFFMYRLRILRDAKNLPCVYLEKYFFRIKVSWSPLPTSYEPQICFYILTIPSSSRLNFRLTLEIRSVTSLCKNHFLFRRSCIFNNSLHQKDTAIQYPRCSTNQSFISPTNAQPICFKILKFTLKYKINAPICFGLTKPSSGSLQYVLR